MRTCRRRRRTVLKRPVSTARRSSSIRAMAKCSRSAAVRPTTRMRSPAESIARRGQNSTRTICGHSRTAPCRAAIPRDRPSRWWSAWPASKKGSSPPTSMCSAAAVKRFSAATSSAGRRADMAASTCGMQSSSRATCFSTRSATCSASIAFTNGRRSSGSA